MLGFVIIKWFRNIYKAVRSLQTGYKSRLKCRSGRLNPLSNLLTKHNPQGSTNNLFLPSSVSTPKQNFMAGYNETLKRIEPETIIC